MVDIIPRPSSLADIITSSSLKLCTSEMEESSAVLTEIWRKKLISIEISPLELKKSPANPFSDSGPRNQEIGQFYVVQERRVTEFEAPKLRKSSSGE